MEREKQIAQLLHTIRGVLSYQKSCSIKEYPGSASLDSFLNNCDWQVAVSPSLVKKQVARTTSVQPSVPSKPTLEIKSDQKKLMEITEEVAVCSSCSLAKQRPCAIPGTGGGEKIRLLIVGHWLQGAVQSTAVFGQEEDSMLQRMLAAIKLPMESVFITNIIKCGIGPETQPQSEHIDACSSYLVRQIAAIAPELICSMGMIATKSLLGLPQPLSQLRGRFHTYQGGDGLEIPLLPTYHPGYLIQNPEMKQATWHDLQVLQKRLASRDQ